MTDEQPADEAALLLEFLRDRDVSCPLCGYNLRNLSACTCPECRETLALAVGFRRPRFGWLLATVIPGFFSGIFRRNFFGFNWSSMNAHQSVFFINKLLPTY